MANAAKRTFKFTQGIGYVGLTGIAGISTFFLATATCALAMTGVGVPLALVTGAGTVGCGAGTIFFAKKSGHKFGRAFEEGDHHHHHRGNDRGIEYGRHHVTTAASMLDHGSNAANQLSSQRNASKPGSANEDSVEQVDQQHHGALFSAPVEKDPNTQYVGAAPVIDTTYESSIMGPAA